MQAKLAKFSYYCFSLFCMVNLLSIIYFWTVNSIKQDMCCRYLNLIVMMDIFHGKKKDFFFLIVRKIISKLEFPPILYPAICSLSSPTHRMASSSAPTPATLHPSLGFLKPCHPEPRYLPGHACVPQLCCVRGILQNKEVNR